MQLNNVYMFPYKTWNMYVFKWVWKWAAMTMQSIKEKGKITSFEAIENSSGDTFHNAQWSSHIGRGWQNCSIK